MNIKKSIYSLVAFVLCFSLEFALQGQDGIGGGEGLRIQHLGNNNTLVRVEGEGRYILFPVQESIDDADVKILVDADAEKTIKVKLAKTRVDYYVPLDLSAYKGHKVALSIVTVQNRTSVREAGDDVCWKDIRLSDTFDTSNREKYRPAYHHTPLYGWMNDPNGMFYKDGTWHLYYQHNSYGSKWQNLSWGHSSSQDLIHWKHHDEALVPGGLGMIFSGSCVVDSLGTAGFGRGAVVGLHTSADINQTQSLVWSEDSGESFTTYSLNPVIALSSEARDPNMFWDSRHSQWVLVLAHALEKEMLFFTSADLKAWTYQSSFGKGLGAQGGVWECPDLFELPIEGTDESRWVLLCNINPGGPFGGSAAQYFVGDFDGSNFHPETDPSGNVPTKWLDYGKDNYATVSWSGAPDGRRTVIGWMSNWQYAAEIPTQQFRSANTLPRDLKLFRGTDNQYYVASVPSAELLSLREEASVKSQRFPLTSKGRNFQLPKANGGICEIVAELDVNGLSSCIELELSNSEGECVMMQYDTENDTFSLDRSDAGVSDFSQDFEAITTAPTFSADGKLQLRIFLDHSSIEVFGQHFVMTNLVFPTSPYTTLKLRCEKGKCKIGNLSIYPLSAE